MRGGRGWGVDTINIFDYFSSAHEGLTKDTEKFNRFDNW